MAITGRTALLTLAGAVPVALAPGWAMLLGWVGVVIALVGIDLALAGRLTTVTVTREPLRSVRLGEPTSSAVLVTNTGPRAVRGVVRDAWQPSAGAHPTRQQQSGIHRGVQPRFVADPGGRGPRGVEHDQHPPIPFRTPGAHHHLLAPGRGAPVDGPHVVADHVVAQRVELGALTPHLQAGAAVEFAQSGQLARQVLARGERRQHP